MKALFSRGMAAGNTHDDGLGLRMGESVGGVAEHMEGAFFTSAIYPPGDTLKGIVVNRLGKRFVNEDVYHSRLAGALFDQPDQVGYLILDSETMTTPKYKFQPLVDGWDTIEEMESALGMPAGALVETMAEYNKHAADGEDAEFHKAHRVGRPARQGVRGAPTTSPPARRSTPGSPSAG